MANPVVDGLNNDALDRYITRIESLHVDRDAITEDIKEVYAEAKSAGFVLADTPLGQAAMADAEKPSKRGRRNAGEAIEAARSHLDGEPAGSA
jgi:hypothetical protein